jgi:hypothetical protein
MIFSENRVPLFRIMLRPARRRLSTILATPAAPQDREAAKRKVGRVKQDPAMTTYIYKRGRNVIPP